MCARVAFNRPNSNVFSVLTLTSRSALRIIPARDARHAGMPKEVAVAVLLRNRLVRAVASFLLTSLCSAACERETPSPPPDAPAATGQPSTKVPAPQQQAPPADKNDGQKPPPASPTTDSVKQRSGRQGATRAPTSFAVYALSRGAGVPPEARAAQLKGQKL